MSVFDKVGVKFERQPMATSILQAPEVVSQAVVPVAFPAVPAAPSGVFSKSPTPSTAIASYLPVKDLDVEQLGEGLAKDVGATTEKIISKMSVGKFEELGSILTAVQVQANKISPASLQKGGLIGWWQRNFTDIKTRLTMQFNSAEEVFDKLESKIAGHVTVHTEWIKDLDMLYTENFTRYNRIVEVIAKGEKWIEATQASLNAWPVIEATDPEAPMKIQAKRDAESLLNRLRVKVDNFKRLKVLAENNSPKIRSQQNTSRNTITTLRSIAEETIPMIKMEFAMFLQSLDANKSNELVAAARELSGKTLTSSADSAKIAAVESAKAMNTPVIATDTLEYIRAKMLETITDVRKIESDAHTQRENDAKVIAESQAKLLSSLQTHNAI